MKVFPFERSGDLMTVDGLLGMNFLERFNFMVRPVERELHLEPVASGESPPAV